MEEIIKIENIEKNDLTLNEIGKKLNVAPGTIRIYFGRPQFNNIQKVSYKGKILYRGITKRTINKLFNLINRKRGGYTS